MTYRSRIFMERREVGDSKIIIRVFSVFCNWVIFCVLKCPIHAHHSWCACIEMCEAFARNYKCVVQPLDDTEDTDLER